jgi:outer membrane immunogenic protein
MRKIMLLAASAALLASPAFAADISAPPIYQSAPGYNWTGFYVGAHAGYAAGRAVVTDTNGGVKPGPFAYSPDGGFGGAQFGYNRQFSSFLIGIEADVAYLGTSGKGVIGSANAASHQDLTLSGGFLGDITGRVGYAFDRFLVYGKGGYAYFDGSAKQQTTNPGYVATGTGAFNGYAVGGGVEYALTQNVSLKAEYLHYDFGTRGGYQTNVGDKTSPLGYQFKNETSLRFDTVKIGANYRF